MGAGVPGQGGGRVGPEAVGGGGAGEEGGGGGGREVAQEEGEGGQGGEGGREEGGRAEGQEVQGQVRGGGKGAGECICRNALYSICLRNFFCRFWLKTRVCTVKSASIYLLMLPQRRKNPVMCFIL